LASARQHLPKWWCVKKSATQPDTKPLAFAGLPLIEFTHSGMGVTFAMVLADMVAEVKKIAQIDIDRTRHLLRTWSVFCQFSTAMVRALELLATF
jgi:crotonobetainyl-CoA:carnitine CoA-transferase CaiB-like acyl-CoA transferase